MSWPARVLTLAPVAKAGTPNGPSSAKATADSPQSSTPRRRLGVALLTR